MAADNLDLTLAVILRNEGRNLPHLLKSFAEGILAHLTDQDICHFLFIDNNSSDQSVHILKSWQDQHPQLSTTVICRDSNHMAQARNQALELATTHWLAFVDGDSRLDTDWWPQVQRVLEEVGPEVFCVGGGARYQRAQRWHDYAQSLDRYFPLGRDEFRKVKVDNVPTNNCLVRREEIIKIGGFDLSLAYVGEDLEMCLRLGGRKHVLYHPTFRVTHCLPENVTAWYRKMAIYGRAQTFVLFRHPTRIPKEKFLPLLSLMVMASLIFLTPLFALSTLTLALISQRVRFYILSFAFYGLGEWVGFFICLLPKKRLASFAWERRKA